jgi:hypothetical protein
MVSHEDRMPSTFQCRALAGDIFFILIADVAMDDQPRAETVSIQLAAFFN